MHTVLCRSVCQMQRLATCKTAAAALPRLQLLPRSLTGPVALARSHQHRGIAIVAAAAASNSQRQQKLPPAPAPRPVEAAEDAFYAEAASSFEQLGIIPAVTDALKAAGFSKPSRVQVCAASSSRSDSAGHLPLPVLVHALQALPHCDLADTDLPCSTCCGSELCMSSTLLHTR
jgi:hypothetical protein